MRARLVTTVFSVLLLLGTQCVAQEKRISPDDLRLSVKPIQIGGIWFGRLNVKYVGDEPNITITSLMINRGKSCSRLDSSRMGFSAFVFGSSRDKIPIDLQFGEAAEFTLTCDDPVEVMIGTNKGYVVYPLEK